MFPIPDTLSLSQTKENLQNFIQFFRSMKENSRQCNSNVKVFIRIRPFKQSESKTEKCLQIKGLTTVAMKDKESNSNISFTFDQIFNEEVSQIDVYEKVAKGIVQSGLQGINGTVFAYGQTSSGKTHTCIGPNFLDSTSKGLLPRMVSELLQFSQTLPLTTEFRLKISMVEIYNEKIRDLIDISKDNLKIRCNKNKGIFIQNITEIIVKEENQAYSLLKKGIQNRAVGTTNMNAQSSRSHMVFIISIYQNDYLAGQAKSSKITLIDLAGSEKISKTGAEGKILQQAKQINKSLSALGKVIFALTDSKQHTHIPYRDSKLTRLLEESLGGNSMTNLIVNVSPSSYNDSETLSSLRFGYRAKAIQNKPKVNRQYTVEQLLKMLEKAELKIIHQAKLIQSMQKKKRTGGYGCFSNLKLQNSLITMHIINEQQLSDSDDSTTAKSQRDTKSQRDQSQVRRSFQRKLSIMNVIASNDTIQQVQQNHQVDNSFSQKQPSSEIKTQQNEIKQNKQKQPQRVGKQRFADILQQQQAPKQLQQDNLSIEQQKPQPSQLSSELQNLRNDFYNLKIKYDQSNLENKKNKIIIERKNRQIQQLQQKKNNKKQKQKFQGKENFIDL